MNIKPILDKIKGTNIHVSFAYDLDLFRTNDWKDEVIIIHFSLIDNNNIKHGSKHTLSTEMQQDIGLLEHYAVEFMRQVLRALNTNSTQQP